MTIIGSLFIPLSVLPIGETSIDGREVSMLEFWKRGGGPIIFCIGILFLILSYGLVRSSRWVRPLVAFVSMTLGVTIIAQDAPARTENIVIGISTALIPIGYFYLYPPTRKYYTLLQDQEMTTRRG